jgi:hypothetical protein
MLLDCPVLFFYLDRGGAARSLLPCDVIKSAPEISLPFLLDDGTYLVERLLFVVVPCDLFPPVRVLLPESLTMLLIERALFLTYDESLSDLLYRQLEGVGDVASPHGPF